jgi:hypothetical protein
MENPILAEDDTFLVSSAQDLLLEFDSKREVDEDKLLMTMINLDDPKVTRNTVDFLSLDHICDKLTDMIVVEDNGARFRATDATSYDRLRLAYRAMTLLSGQESSYGFALLMDKCAGRIMKNIMTIFDEGSGGSFHHAESIILFFLETRPAVVHDRLIDGGVKSFRENMLMICRHIGHKGVLGMLKVLLTEPVMSPHLSVPDHMARFYNCLREANLIEIFALILSSPSKMCINSGDVTDINHIESVIEIVSFLIDVLKTRDHGNILNGLDGQNKFFVRLFEIVLDISLDSRLRCKTVKLLANLVVGSLNDTTVLWVTDSVDQPPRPEYMINKLFRIKNDILEVTGNFFGRFVHSCEMTGKNNGSKVPSTIWNSEVYVDGEERSIIEHPGGYNITRPFGTLRMEMVSFIANMISSHSAALAEQLTTSWWKQLVTWVSDYPYNDILHSLVYRIFFSVLRGLSDKAIEIMLSSESGFLEFITSRYIPYESIFKSNREEKMSKDSKLSLAFDMKLRGFRLQCGNAIRLHISSLPQDHSLRKNMESNQKWCDFVPKLLDDSYIQQTGAQLQDKSLSNYEEHPEDAQAYLVDILQGSDSSSSGAIVTPKCLDHGSFLARNLGFDGECDLFGAKNSELQKRELLIANGNAGVMSWDNDTEDDVGVD